MIHSTAIIFQEFSTRLSLLPHYRHSHSYMNMPSIFVASRGVEYSVQNQGKCSPSSSHPTSVRIRPCTLSSCCFLTERLKDPAGLFIKMLTWTLATRLPRFIHPTFKTPSSLRSLTLNPNHSHHHVFHITQDNFKAFMEWRAHRHAPKGLPQSSLRIKAERH